MAHRVRGVTVAGLSPPQHLPDGVALWGGCYRQGFRLRALGVSVLTNLVELSEGLTCMLPPESLAVGHGPAAGLFTRAPHEVTQD